MPNKKLSKDVAMDAVRLWYRCNKSYTLGSRISKVPRTTIQTRVDIAKVMYPEIFAQIELEPSAEWTYPQQLEVTFDNGVVLIGSDAHIWPGPETVMMKAFVAVSRKLKPDVIVLNGDILDGAKVSRHGSLLNAHAPKLSAEIDAATKWIAKLQPSKHRIWTMGNHDQRVDHYLANNAPELDDYAGRISDRFPTWEFCWAVNINGVEIRHRFRSGIHAGWNNALHSGVTTITGHTHQLQVTAVRNRNGTHWGIEDGMLGDPSHKCFEYGEGTPSRAQPGFLVLSFIDGVLMPPEMCELINGEPVFRGKHVL